MTMFELWMLGASASKRGPAEAESLFRQTLTTFKELPGIFRGLKKPAQVFWRQLVIISLLNASIAAWGFAQPWVLELNIDTLLRKNAVYSEVVWTITLSFVFVTLVNTVVLPFIRNFYTTLYLRPNFKRSISLRCLRHQRSLSPASRKEFGKGGPILQEGRDAAFEMVEFFTREPFQIAKGFGTLLYLFFISPLLTLVVGVAVCVDWFVTAKMKHRTEVLQSQMQSYEFEIKAMENKMLDEHGLTAQTLQAYRASWHTYTRLIRQAERPRLIYSTFWRGVPARLINIGTMLLLAWWVHTGQITMGQYTAYLAYVAVANDPFEIFLNFIWDMVPMREKLRRFGLLAGIDFKLAPPK